MSTLHLSTSAALILVIDDNPENLLLLATQLGMEGWQIAHVDQAGNYYLQRLMIPDNDPDE